MPLTFKKGDIFAEPVEAIVNTVNCVGVMGKGVALEFKKRWPENYKAYKKICDAKKLSPGKMFVFDTHQLFIQISPRYLINFPTKMHWRSKSKLSFIEDGLDALVDELKRYNIQSIAIPPLGCGNGGLDWKEVKLLIEMELSNLDKIDIIVIEPMYSVDKPEYVNSDLQMTFQRAILLKSLCELEDHFSKSFDRISLQKLIYFLQEFGVEFNLEFSKNLRGPYSVELKKAFIAFEKADMINGFTAKNRQAHVTRSGYAIANEYLKENNELEKADNLIEKLNRFIQGYESPYGLELLSSVHWLAKYEKHNFLETIISEMKNWTPNKRNLFDEESIKFAYTRLIEDKLISY